MPLLRIITAAATTIVILLLLPVSLHAVDANDGRLYKEALVKAIKGADRIVVIEHSDRMDFPREDVNRPDLPLFEYGRVELDPSAKTRFLKNVEAMDPTTQDIFTCCIFESHHSVAFYSGSTLKSTMRVCFYCGDIYWDGSKRAYPRGIWSAIIPLIKDVGFHEKRNWKELLNDRRRKSG